MTAAVALAGCHFLWPYASQDRAAGDLSGVPVDGGADAPPRPTDGNITGACVSRVGGSSVSFAVCEGFTTPAGNGGRSGDLDPALWSVARRSALVNAGQGMVNLWPTATIAGCGSAAPAPPPDDVRVCDGRLYEASNDAGSVTMLAFSLLQPFDWAGRTGTLVFDVSADSAGSASAYPTLWISDQLLPAPSGQTIGSGQPPYIRNGVGITLAIGACKGDQTKTGLDSMIVLRDYVAEGLAGPSTACVTKGQAGGALNHFEVRLSRTRIEVWGADPGSSAMVQLAVRDNLDLPLTRGFVSFGDVHNSPFKGPDPTQEIHTFAWDDIGFDGPVLPRYASFDVADANLATQTGSGAAATNLGYTVGSAGTTLETADVSWPLPPAEAFVALGWFALDDSVPGVRVNGGSWIDVPWTGDATAFCWRSIVIPVPPAAVVGGKNKLEFRAADVAGGPVVVSNVSLVLGAASDVGPPPVDGGPSGDAASCSGCLGGGQCWPGTDDQICGRNGGPCMDCLQSQEICSNGVCFPK